MGLLDIFFKKKQENRNYGYDLSYPSFFNASSGEVISKDQSLRLTTVWSCVKIISETIASLPISLYEQDENGRKNILYQNPLSQLVGERPSPLYNSFSFFERTLIDLCLEGNFYAYIERNGGGLPTALFPILCEDVKVYVSPEGRDVYYDIKQNVSIPYPITGKVNSQNMLHIRGLSTDGIVGKSPIQSAAESIGISLALDKYAGSFYKNSASVSGILQHPGTLKPETAKRLRASWNSTYGGSINSGKTAILEEGMTWTPRAIPNNQAQFLETRQMQVSEICRIFRVPNHLVNDLNKISYNSIEAQQIDFVQSTITPWVRRIEIALNHKLIPKNNRPSQYFKFNLNAIMRGDTKARADYYRTLVNIGVLTPDEVRAYEDLNSIGGANEKTYMQSNMLPLEDLGQSTTRNNIKEQDAQQEES